MSHFTELDAYLFGQGTHYDIFRKLGAHPGRESGKDGFYFDVWAPHAKEVHVIGEFNGWDELAAPMTKVTPETIGVWECFIPGAKKGQMYKYLSFFCSGNKTFPEQKKDRCTNISSTEVTMRNCTRQILLQSTRRYARERRADSGIRQASSGQTLNG